MNDAVYIESGAPFVVSIATQNCMKNHAIALVWACIGVLAGARTHAAEVPDIGELSIEQLMDLSIDSVYSASRYEQRVTQAPSSVSIVTSEDIRRAGYTSFADIMRSVRGLYVSDDRNYSYLGVRGFHRPGDYNTRMLVLIDGHRLNDNVYDSGSTDRDGMLDVELIDRVEIIRGPSSSVYGSSAFFGVINVMTKRGAQLSGRELGQEAGSLDTYRTYTLFGDTLTNGLEWMASASHYASDGQNRLYYPQFDERISDNPRARAHGEALGLDDEEATKFFSKVNFGSLTASAYYSERNKQVPTASFGAIFGDPDNATTDKRGYIDVTWDGRLGQVWQYRARGFFDHMGYAGMAPLDYGSEEATERVIFKDSGVGEWLGTELQATGRFLRRYEVVIGAEYRANLRADQISYDDVQPRLYYLDDHRSSNVVGAFAQVETTLRDDLRVTTGLRYDHYSAGVGGTLNPRIAAIYNPSARSALKLLYGEAFRAPNPYEEYYFLYGAQQSRPALKPETIKTSEIVYEHYLGSRLRLNLSAYRYRISGLITQTDNDAGEPYYDNAGAVSAHGVEMELEAKFHSGVQARASYTVQRARDAATDTELTSSPHQLAKLNLSLPVWKKTAYANLELQYYDTSRTLAGLTTQDFLLTNLSLNSAQLWSNVEVTLAIKNAFDAREVYPAAEEHLQDTLQLNGRTYMGRLVVRF